MAENEMIDIQQLQSFIPLNALTVNHLKVLLRGSKPEYLYQGQALFTQGDKGNCHIYLLHGKLLISTTLGKTAIVCADEHSSRFAIADLQPGIVSAVAQSDCSLVRVDRNALDNMLCWDQTAHSIIADIGENRYFDEDAAWMETLLKSNLFYKVPPMNIRQILDCFQALYLPAGKVVLRQGEAGDCCYFIKEGSVDVLQADDAHGPAKHIARLGLGLFFGEDALLNETTRNATIVMRENGVLMRLAKADFYKLLKKPQVDTLSYTDAVKRYTQAEQWLDVRTTDEYSYQSRDGALNLPLNLLKLKSRILDKHTPYIAYCNTGTRAEAAVWLLQEKGFDICALNGGINKLSAEQRSDFGIHCY